MAEAVFGEMYSAAYDDIYAEKNYQAECGFLYQAFRRFSSRPVREIADFGCGTGGHAMRLAADGLDVTGVDASPTMLRMAREKLEGGGAQGVTLLQGDIASVSLGHQFDAIVMMFAVLGYQTTNAQLRATLANVRRHLRPDGLFIADFWYGPAVLATRPSDRIRIIPRPSGKLIRCARTRLDTRTHLAHVTFDLWEIDQDELVREVSETHDMRYFFPEELSFHLELAGLAMLALVPFLRLDLPVGDDTWNAAVIARAM